MKSFIKRQWNKIGTADEVESSGLVMVKHIQKTQIPNVNNIEIKLNQSNARKKRNESCRIFQFLSLCCPVVVTLWYILSLSILF